MPLMRRTLATATIVLTLAAGAGCRSGERPLARSPDEAAMLGPASARLHRVFTRVRDWTGDGRADGVEVLLELRDAFGDPTKALGTAVFDVYAYRPAAPDPRGDRLAGPFEADLSTAESQREHYARTSRTYTFQLALPTVGDGPYVVTASFQNEGGERLFDQMVLDGRS